MSFPDGPMQGDALVSSVLGEKCPHCGWRHGARRPAGEFTTRMPDPDGRPDVTEDRWVDGFAPDYIKVSIDWDRLRDWAMTASAAGITREGIDDLLRLRITRKAEEAGAAFRLGPEIHQMIDPIGYCVRANGTGLTVSAVNAALDELTEQAEAARALA